MAPHRPSALDRSAPVSILTGDREKLCCGACSVDPFRPATLEKAAAMANHASTRTTQLYDRRRDELSLDEVERIVI